MSDRQCTEGRIAVGHTIHAFKDGGMERGLLNIVNYGDHDRFYHVILCLTQAGVFADQLRSPACKLVELQKRAGNDLRLPGRIAAAARQYKLNVLHARGWPTLVETALAARLAGIRATVYGFHGRTMEELQGISPRRRWAQKVMIRSYRRVMTLNRRMRAELAAECGLSEDRIRIVANGVNVDTFRPCEDRNAIRAVFGLPTDRFVIGNVARLDPVKNHEVILRAVCRVRDCGLKPLFLLVGEGPHRAVLEQEIRRLQIATDVCLFGYSDRISALLNCMDLYVQSSFYEGFSNTVLEAMACGLPVLATDVGGTADLFESGLEGFLFQPDDDEALASLIMRFQQDIPLRCSMAERARRYVVEHFSVYTMVRNYEAMYLELVAEGNSRKNFLTRIVPLRFPQESIIKRLP
jgi:sugar transferase (PEP-CTERM/EpsH1 system associated)